jgi:hypothetical protein
MPFPLNWYAGWSMILAGFISGAVLGLFFQREDFLGGYMSWRRRLLRLGHIACVALGFLNLLYAVSPVSGHSRWAAGGFLVIGGVAMPLACALAAWKKSLKGIFVVPVASLITAVVLILLNSLSAS